MIVEILPQFEELKNSARGPSGLTGKQNLRVNPCLSILKLQTPCSAKIIETPPLWAKEVSKALKLRLNIFTIAILPKPKKSNPP